MMQKGNENEIENDRQTDEKLGQQGHMIAAYVCVCVCVYSHVNQLYQAKTCDGNL